MSERLVAARDALESVSGSPRTQLVVRMLVVAVRAILEALLERSAAPKVGK